MMFEAAKQRLPRFLRRYVLDFERRIDHAVARFAAELSPGALVLDAGAGEAKHRALFQKQRYVGVDLGIGDPAWNYGALDVMADLLTLPFATASFDACLNIVTLEHLTDPGPALAEIARVLKPGGNLLVAAPHEWEVHQAPHDYFRFTRYGIRLLLERAGFTAIHVYPAGGLFRLLSRRLLSALQYFHGFWFLVACAVLAPPALILPVFDRLDRARDFTLGYLCTARRSS